MKTVSFLYLIIIKTIIILVIISHNCFCDTQKLNGAKVTNRKHLPVRYNSININIKKRFKRQSSDEDKTMSLKFVDEPQDLEVQVNSFAELKCKFEGPYNLLKKLDVIWSKNFRALGSTNYLSLTMPSYSIKPDENFDQIDFNDDEMSHQTSVLSSQQDTNIDNSNVTITTRSFNLLISPVQFTDDANFSCQSNSKPSRLQSREAKLSVVQIPQKLTMILIKQAQDLDISNKSNTLLLTETFSSNNNLDKHGFSYSNSNNNNNNNNDDDNDTGPGVGVDDSDDDYKNSDIQTNKLIKNTEQRHDKQFVTPQLRVRQNSSLVLGCSDKDSKPRAKVEWFDGKNDKVLDNISLFMSSNASSLNGHQALDSSILVWSQLVTRDLDNNILTCTATHSAMKVPLRANIKIIVEYAPIVRLKLKSQNQTLSNLIEGSSATFECLAEAEPKVSSYRWFLDSQLLDSQDARELQFETITKNLNNLQLRCEAQNSVSSSSSEPYNLQVDYLPAVLPRDELDTNTNTNTNYSTDNKQYQQQTKSGGDEFAMALKKNSKAELHCTFEANPRISSVFWYKLNSNFSILGNVSSEYANHLIEKGEIGAMFSLDGKIDWQEMSELAIKEVSIATNKGYVKKLEPSSQLECKQVLVGSKTNVVVALSDNDDVSIPKLDNDTSSSPSSSDKRKTQAFEIGPRIANACTSKLIIDKAEDSTIGKYICIGQQIKNDNSRSNHNKIAKAQFVGLQTFARIVSKSEQSIDPFSHSTTKANVRVECLAQISCADSTTIKWSLGDRTLIHASDLQAQDYEVRETVAIIGKQKLTLNHRLDVSPDFMYLRSILTFEKANVKQLIAFLENNKHANKLKCSVSNKFGSDSMIVEPKLSESLGLFGDFDSSINILAFAMSILLILMLIACLIKPKSAHEKKEKKKKADVVVLSHHPNDSSLNHSHYQQPQPQPQPHNHQYQHQHHHQQQPNEQTTLQKSTSLLISQPQQISAPIYSFNLPNNHLDLF